MLRPKRDGALLLPDVLRHVTTTAERSGDLTRSLGASALLLALPVDPASRSAQQAVHQRLLSRLN